MNDHQHDDAVLERCNEINDKAERELDLATECERQGRDRLQQVREALETAKARQESADDWGARSTAHRERADALLAESKQLRMQVQQRVDDRARKLEGT